MRAVLTIIGAWVASSVTAGAITIDTVAIGNANNGPDSTGFGSVSNDYRIGSTEVTNAQYAAFLNAKATSDPLALYDPNMSDGYGGITRTGTDGSFTYTTIAGRENKPVVYVSWYDALRFSNWLHNGQGNGDTESGAYTLTGGTIVPGNGPTITRNPGATWYLPSENEWYKAAYYDPASNSYYAYPTSSNSAPNAQLPPGDSNSANYAFVLGDLTEAGAYSTAQSPYGTFDQGGNVWEWNEALNNSFRTIRGGSWNDISAFLASSTRGYFSPNDSGSSLGFRVAAVPEPSSLTIAALGIIATLAWQWRRR